MGYMLGGLDWTGTALGQAFQSQEQVLFMFAAIVFIVSVILHMVSIPEQPFVPPGQLKVTGNEETTSQSSFQPVSRTPPFLGVIAEEDGSAQAPDNESDAEDDEKDFLTVERVRSKSDSVLAMPDATIELDPDLDPDRHLFLPEAHYFLTETQGDLDDAFKPSDHSIGSSPPTGGPLVLTDRMVVLESANPASLDLKGSTNSRPSLLRIRTDSADLQVKLYVC